MSGVERKSGENLKKLYQELNLPKQSTNLLSEITTKDIRTYFLFLDSRRDVPLAPSTRNKYRSVLSKLFRLSYEEGAINKPIIMPKFEEKRDNPRPSFTDDEYKHLLDTIRKMADSKVRTEGMHIDNSFIILLSFLLHHLCDQ